MKKIAKSDQDKIVRLLKKWPDGLPLTWEGLRNKLASMNNIGLEDVWSRQSLSANHEVYLAFSATKRRFKEDTAIGKSSRAGSQENRTTKLQTELTELQARYDILLLRHAQLAYNASLLEGGSHLLSDPLPDNTKSQRGK